MDDSTGRGPASIDGMMHELFFGGLIAGDQISPGINLGQLGRIKAAETAARWCQQEAIFNHR